MHSAIVYVRIPESSRYGQQQTISAMLAGIAKLEGNKSAVKLGESVWEVNFRDAPDALAILVRIFGELSLPYGILPHEAAPQWIKRPPDQD